MSIPLNQVGMRRTRRPDFADAAIRLCHDNEGILILDGTTFKSQVETPGQLTDGQESIPITIHRLKSSASRAQLPDREMIVSIVIEHLKQVRTAVGESQRDPSVVHVSTTLRVFVELGLGHLAVIVAIDDEEELGQSVDRACLLAAENAVLVLICGPKLLNQDSGAG